MSARVGVAQRSHLNPRSRGDVSWQAHAACVGLPSEVFFPDKGQHITEGARRVCGGCEVRNDCLAYALAHRELAGIWGGKSERQRQGMATKRRKTA